MKTDENKSSMPGNADGKFVIIENGRRVGGLYETEAEAQKEADRRNRLNESRKAQKSGTACVKQNIFG